MKYEKQNKWLRNIKKKYSKMSPEERLLALFKAFNEMEEKKENNQKEK
jgi:hypothetical protein